jgi:signal transduction histidine kinase
MKRMLSLRSWLSLGLVAAIAAPAAAGAGAWLAAGTWQTGRENARTSAALRLLKRSPLDTAADLQTLSAALTRLGVEADVSLYSNGATTGLIAKDKFEAVKPPGSQLITPGLAARQQGPDFKQRITTDYVTSSVSLPGVEGTLFVGRQSVAARWAIALGAAVAALAAVLVLAVGLLRRWVLRPLARLATDAERIAGGELAIEPVVTRAREVAQVGDALGGMAGALEDALGVSTAAERERRFLVTAIAHDLRTPLFTLRGSLEAIEHGIGNGDALARAQDKAAHLDRLVGDLFVYSRAEYTRDGHADEPVDLAEIARRAAETVEPGRVRLDVVANGPVPLSADPIMLQRVLTNLLDNALRHARTRVELRVSGTRVDVADDGPGFAPEDLPHVFEPLFRGDRARAAATGGAGLGLAIARRLVHAHGGEVEAINLPTGGARVTVTLPPPPAGRAVPRSTTPGGWEG